jgi:hypothetical protein
LSSAFAASPQTALISLRQKLEKNPESAARRFQSGVLKGFYSPLRLSKITFLDNLLCVSVLFIVQ